jgi:hypothetical protein
MDFILLPEVGRIVLGWDFAKLSEQRGQSGTSSALGKNR